MQPFLQFIGSHIFLWVQRMVCFCCWHSPAQDMNNRIFLVHVMERVRTQTGPRCIFSSVSVCFSFPVIFCLSLCLRLLLSPQPFPVLFTIACLPLYIPLCPPPPSPPHPTPAPLLHSSPFPPLFLSRSLWPSFLIQPALLVYSPSFPFPYSASFSVAPHASKLTTNLHATGEAVTTSRRERAACMLECELFSRRAFLGL